MTRLVLGPRPLPPPPGTQRWRTARASFPDGACLSTAPGAAVAAFCKDNGTPKLRGGASFKSLCLGSDGLGVGWWVGPAPGPVRELGARSAEAE